MNRILYVAALAVVASTLVVGASLNRKASSLAPTPPMGWMSWEIFRCEVDCTTHPDTCISEELYKQQTDRLAADGFLAAGYEGIHIDDCWEQKNPPRESGRLVANTTRFPSGLKSLSDYMHDKKVKFGLYTAESTSTCGGYPASKGYETQDANSFASWGVDYIKVDGCGQPDYYPTGYPLMGEALINSGRDIVYSCSWPAYLGNNETTKPYDSMIAAHCNLWRNWADIQCNNNSLFGIIDHYGDYSEVLQKYAAPGHFNDPDMLLIGNTCISDDEARTQMAIWSILAAPLIMGNDLRHVSQSAKDILLNKEAIAVDQDPMGRAGIRVSPKQSLEVWSRELSTPLGSRAVGLLNKQGVPVPAEPCPSWNVTEQGYLEACGGGAGNIECWGDRRSLETVQKQCCDDVACAGFSYNAQSGTGCTKRNQDCGLVKAEGYNGYSKPHFHPATPGPANITVHFNEIGISGSARVRDLWTHKDLGVFERSFTAENVPIHGTAFLKITPL